MGWHIVQMLADRGYAIVVHYHSSPSEAEETVKQLRERKVDALALHAEMRDDRSVAELIQKTLAKFGRLDVLVNCASTYRSQKLEEVTAENLRYNFEVNTLGVFLCSQRAGLAMAGQKEGGNIILLGDWATRRPYLNYPAYLCSKGAIPTMTRVLAVELGTRNPRVRVNCIMPGPVLLPPDMPEAEKRQAIEATLVKREGKPGNVSQAVAFLLENDFVTGTCIPVDGGRTIFAPEPS
jgi:pteridine reductase